MSTLLTVFTVLQLTIAFSTTDAASQQLVLPFTKVNNSFYQASVGFGSPPQYVNMLIDTGSSDTWVHSADYFEDQGNGVFQPNKSSTYYELYTSFELSYNDGSHDSGYYAADAITFNNETTSYGFQFGVVTNSTDSIGILALGPQDGENATYEYQNLPLYLADRGIVDKAIFSVVLNDVNGNTGEIIFGSTDDSLYYQGDLISHELGVVCNESSYYAVALGGLYHGTRYITLTDTYSHFDTGFTDIQFPTEIYDYIGPLLDITLISSLDTYVFNCNTTKNFTIAFENQNISLPLTDIRGNTLLVNETQMCSLAISRNDRNQFVFGESFFKNVYTVFDLENDEILLGKALRPTTIPSSSKNVNYPVSGSSTTTTLSPSNTSSYSSGKSKKTGKGFTKFSSSSSSYSCHGMHSWWENPVKFFSPSTSIGPTGNNWAQGGFQQQQGGKQTPH